MSKLLKVTLEFDDKIMTAGGEEAEKWQKHTDSFAILGFVHGMTPFQQDPVKWDIKEKLEDNI